MASNISLNHRCLEQTEEKLKRCISSAAPSSGIVLKRNEAIALLEIIRCMKVKQKPSSCLTGTPNLHFQQSVLPKEEPLDHEDQSFVFGQCIKKPKSEPQSISLGHFKSDPKVMMLPKPEAIHKHNDPKLMMLPKPEAIHKLREHTRTELNNIKRIAHNAASSTMNGLNNPSQPRSVGCGNRKNEPNFKILPKPEAPLKPTRAELDVKPKYDSSKRKLPPSTTPVTMRVPKRPRGENSQSNNPYLKRCASSSMSDESSDEIDSDDDGTYEYATTNYNQPQKSDTRRPIVLPAHERYQNTCRYDKTIPLHSCNGITDPRKIGGTPTMLPWKGGRKRKHWVCRIEGCGKPYIKKKRLFKHIRVEHLGVWVNCFHCAESFTSVAERKRHFRNRHTALYKQNLLRKHGLS